MKRTDFQKSEFQKPAITAALLGTALGILALGGCAAKPDPSRPFEMAMNGTRYESRLQEPIGYFQEVEAGFSTECRCSILFPLHIPGTVPHPGLEITFDPRKIVPGAEMTFGAEDSESGIDVDYTPMGGHQMSRGIMLGFSSGRAGGHGRVRFDILEPQPGGRVKGTLLHATLSGYYESAESARTTEPEPARKLELWNFPFDVTLARSPLGDG